MKLNFYYPVNGSVFIQEKHLIIAVFDADFISVDLLFSNPFERLLASLNYNRFVVGGLPTSSIKAGNVIGFEPSLVAKFIQDYNNAYGTAYDGFRFVLEGDYVSYYGLTGADEVLLESGAQPVIEGSAEPQCLFNIGGIAGLYPLTLHLAFSGVSAVDVTLDVPAPVLQGGADLSHFQFITDNQFSRGASRHVPGAAYVLAMVL